MANYVLYNPKANGGNSLNSVKALMVVLDDKSTLIDVFKITSYERFFNGLNKNDKVIICGGDGTLNKFVNNIKDIKIDLEVYYFPCGTGNDFYKDVKVKDEELILINDLIKNLPTVKVNDKEYNFINGVGYGIDGFCCAEGDILNEKGKKANYTNIAIKGLLYKYKPCDAKITVDGMQYEYKKVWLAPAMYGKYYGGGMIPAPIQNRGDDKVSVMLFHGSNKLKTLMVFPKIFKGEHVKCKKHVAVHSGKNIKVEFSTNKPCQIDGETILDVISYEVNR